MGTDNGNTVEVRNGVVKEGGQGGDPALFFTALTFLRIPHGAACAEGSGPSLVEQTVLEGGGSMNGAIAAANRLGLSQAEAIEAITTVTQNSGRAIGGVVEVANGGRVMLSARIGAAQPVIHVAADGVATLGRATIELEGLALKVTDLVL